MTIASEIVRIKNAIQNAYTACSSKGAILPAILNSDNLYFCIDSIPSGPTPSGTVLNMFDRVNGNSTVAGFWNYESQMYAICVLDSEYHAYDRWKTSSTITDVLPTYNSGANVTSLCIPATTSMELILSNGLLSDHTAFEFCSTAPLCYIDNKVFNACLPNSAEGTLIAQAYTELDSIDPTSSTYSLSYFFDSGTKGIWSTEQKTGGTQTYRIKGYNVTPGATSKTSRYGICPIYEIPVDENGRVL